MEACFLNTVEHFTTCFRFWLPKHENRLDIISTDTLGRIQASVKRGRGTVPKITAKQNKTSYVEPKWMPELILYPLRAPSSALISASANAALKYTNVSTVIWQKKILLIMIC